MSESPDNEQKPVNETEKDKRSRSLSFEISPQLFWTIFTAIIGVAFYLGFNFGEQRSNKEIAQKEKEIQGIVTDTQKDSARLVDRLHTRVTLLDTRTNSERLSDLFNNLKFKFVKIQRFATGDSFPEDIQSKPDIFVAHWHAYREDGDNAHDTASETLLINMINMYIEANPAIRIIVFSSTFGDPNEKERFDKIVSGKISNSKERVSAYPLHKHNNKDEVLAIVANILSISIEHIQKVSK